VWCLQRQFLEMVRYGSKKKKENKKANEYLESFKKVVKKEQEGLQSLLEEKAAERCVPPLSTRVFVDQS